MRAIVLAAAFAAFLSLPAAATAQLAPCPEAGWMCGTVTVPLDHSGALAGTVAVHYAIQAPGPPGVLLFLTGGPGQRDLRYKANRPFDFRALTGRYRIATLDPRGAGESDALNCAAAQQALSAASIAACGQQLGPARALYTALDVAFDIEEVRKALGVETLALVGTSYGTYMAQQYARAFPTRVERLILNSTLGPEGTPAFDQNLQSIPSVLQNLCANGACRRATPDPLADLTALLRGRGRMGGLTELGLARLIQDTDLNAHRQSLLPGALRAAAQGDPAPLLRLAQWGSTGLARAAQAFAPEFSIGLNLAAGCQETVLPYGTDSALAARLALLEAALPTVAPWSRATERARSFANTCLFWPPTPPRSPITATLPDVPALILAGTRDLHTPVGNAAVVKALLPHAQVLYVDAGHDLIHADPTGCVQNAMALFVAGQSAESACVGQRLGPAVAPRPPATLRRVAPAKGLRGTRGRVVGAVRATLGDAGRIVALSRSMGKPAASGSGLRGGSMALVSDTRLRLRRYAYVPGVRLSGTIAYGPRLVTGRLTISGRLKGALSVSRSGLIRGRIGGAKVRSKGSPIRVAT